MTTRFTAALFLLLFFRAVSVAQIAPSDSLFNNDQVVQVDLHFGNDDFWSTLVQHYENDLGETLVADVTISDQTGSRMYYNVEVALKGNSSYGHPGNKKSFKIDLNDNIQGQKYHGMAKVHFNNCWSDPTFMREKVFFDYCRDQGVFAPRVLYANVSMNGTYWGFYDLVEAVDKDFLDRWMDDNNGNLFKAADNFGMGGGGGGGSAEADLAYHGPSQISYATRYELKTNETQNDWSDLIVFVGTLNNSTDAELLTALPTSMSWENTLRSLALDNIFGNLDSYINSARNYYVYHDSTNFLWNWIKWDGNMAFGSYPAQGQNALTLSPTYVANNRPLLQKIMAIPELRTQYLNAYCEVRENFTNDHLDQKIDAIRDLIAPHVAADGNKQYSLTQFNSNIEGDITVTGGGPGGMQVLRGLKSFINTRATNLASALDCTFANVDDLAQRGSFRVYPNPAEDLVFFDLPEQFVVTELRLTDALGRRIPTERQGKSLSTGSLKPGVYVLSLFCGQQQFTTRIEKQ